MGIPAQLAATAMAKGKTIDQEEVKWGLKRCDSEGGMRSSHVLSNILPVSEKRGGSLR